MDLKYFKRIATFAIMSLVVVALAGCGGSGKKADKNSNKNADVNSQGLDANGCKPAQRPKSKTVKLSKPTNKLDPSKTHTVTFETNCGSFTVKLDAKKNPKTAASVAYLAREGVYDNTWFHRIITDFVAQGGDPLGNGKGDAGYKVTEKPRGKYKMNTMAMAKGGNEPAGTSGSQFYIVIGKQGTTLPADYAIAGRVVKGADTLQRIAGYAAAGADQTGTPTGTAVVLKATYKASK